MASLSLYSQTEIDFIDVKSQSYWTSLNIKERKG